jgi:hypothetical protein
MPFLFFFSCNAIGQDCSLTYSQPVPAGTFKHNSGQRPVDILQPHALQREVFFTVWRAFLLHALPFSHPGGVSMTDNRISKSRYLSSVVPDDADLQSVIIFSQIWFETCRRFGLADYNAQTAWFYEADAHLRPAQRRAEILASAA